MNEHQRNHGVDLFRCLLVYGICAYHAFFCCGHASGYEARLWTWAVPGFAFVSGYFGVSFKWTKFVRLLLTGCACAVLPWLLGGSYRVALFGYWYLYAYALLMILSPLINFGLSAMRKAHDYRPLWGVAVLAVWSWLTDFALTRQYLPRVSGMGMLSFVSVFVAYVLGWCACEFPTQMARVRPWWLVILIPLSAFVGHYTSPVTLLIVIVLFASFAKIKVSSRWGGAISAVASAGLTVYLLHANWPMLGLMREAIEWALAHGIPRIIALAGTALTVFVAGSVAHLLVRGVGCFGRLRKCESLKV